MFRHRHTHTQQIYSLRNETFNFFCVFSVWCCRYSFLLLLLLLLLFFFFLILFAFVPTCIYTYIAVFLHLRRDDGGEKKKKLWKMKVKILNEWIFRVISKCHHIHIRGSLSQLCFFSQHKSIIYLAFFGETFHSNQKKITIINFQRAKKSAWEMQCEVSS